MTQSQNHTLPQLVDGVSDHELYLSTGGVIAVLAGAGALAAGNLAGIRKWKRIHGASGGSIVASAAACGTPPEQLLHQVLDLDFSHYVDWQGGLLGGFARNAPSWRRAVPGQGDWRECSMFGLLSTDKLGRRIQDYADEYGLNQEWPEGLSVVATTRYGHPVVFHERGVFMAQDGQKVVWSDKPAPLPLAVRASCTIGGVMVPLDCQDWVLFDGGLSPEGFCPVGVPIKYLGSDPKKMIAVRTNEVHSTTLLGKVHKLIRLLWLVEPNFDWGPETAGVAVVDTPIQHVHMLKFELSRDEKWLGILIAFHQMLATLALKGMLSGDKLLQAEELMDELGFWRAVVPARLGEAQLLSIRAEKVFARHGLY